MRRFFAFFLLLLLLLSGCDVKKPDPIRIGLPDWLGYQPLAWADRHYLEQGEIELVEIPSNVESLRLFNNGLLDLTCVTLDDALRLTHNNSDLVIIAVLDISHGGDMLVADKEIPSIHALKGRRIGFEKEGAGAYLLERILEKAGLSADDVTLVPVNYLAQEESYRTKKVDALITFEPMASKLLDAGAHRIFDSSMIPDEIVDIMIGREAVVRQNLARVRKIIHAWYKASADVQTRHSLANDYLSGYLDMTHTQLDAGYEGIKFIPADEARTLLMSDRFSHIIDAIHARVTKADHANHGTHHPELVRKELLELLY
jgi:NitT/TauT family transport system substrate-binding protein